MCQSQCGCWSNFARHGGTEQLGVSVGVEENQLMGLRWEGDSLWGVISNTYLQLVLFSIWYCTTDIAVKGRKNRFIILIYPGAIPPYSLPQLGGVIRVKIPQIKKRNEFAVKF